MSGAGFGATGFECLDPVEILIYATSLVVLKLIDEFSVLLFSVCFSWLNTC